MDLDTPGFSEFVYQLKSLCYTRTLYVLNATNAQFEFYGETTPGGVAFSGKILSATGERAGNSEIVGKIAKWIDTFSSVVVVVKSYIDESALETVYPKKEIRSFTVTLDGSQVTYKKVPGDELAHALSISKTTGDYVEPGPDVIYP